MNSGCVVHRTPVSDEKASCISPNPPIGVAAVAERAIRDMAARLSGRFWTVGAGERLATVMWSPPARDRTQQETLAGRSGASLGDVRLAGG